MNARASKISRGLSRKNDGCRNTAVCKNGLRLTGERSIVRVLNDCQLWWILLLQYDESMCLI